MRLESINAAELRNRQGEKWQHYDADVIPAWVADMDFIIAPSIRAALQQRIDRADLGYPLGHRRNGLPELFCQRVAARFNWTVDRKDVVIINDVVQGLYLSVLALSAPGDGLVIQTPIYPPFLHCAEETGRRAVCCPLQAGETHYEIDFDYLNASIDGTTRMLMLCNPHNPTGRAFSRNELEQLAELACRHDLAIVSDEIHADLVLDEGRHIPIASLDNDVAARTITLMSASKAFNIAGLCMAFAHIGNAELRQRFEAIPPHARGATNTMSIAAVHAAWTKAQDWQDAVIAQLRDNRQRLAEFSQAHWPQIRHLPPQATYLAWLDMRALELGQPAQAYLLQHARVALSEGKAFGEPGRGFIRLNFATSPEILEDILARMDKALRPLLS